MGDKYLLICATCEEKQWLELYEIPDFFIEHSGHKVMMFPDDAIGATEPFEKAIDVLITLFSEEAP